MTCALGGGCPDCNAVMQPKQISPGVVVIGIFHDDTCPAFAAMKKRAARGLL